MAHYDALTRPTKRRDESAIIDPVPVEPR